MPLSRSCRYLWEDFTFQKRKMRNAMSHDANNNRAFLVRSDVRGLSNVSIDIPLAVAAGTTVNMSCKYDLQSDTLYTVKWYKQGAEFFRYVPKEMPPIGVFGELGARVVVCNTLR
ncbi:hypothetical protein G5I_12407 [Acromyrmex echinatior]|uniref:Ig-like domain-containing protein n=1 Tax=Acromyrmex echinatior TaxID=103372 RepID=F4X285_ACREC|nr:hypothetical protein G5I_12407 [Acromyrmex echinatior]